MTRFQNNPSIWITCATNEYGIRSYETKLSQVWHASKTLSAGFNWYVHFVCMCTANSQIEMWCKYRDRKKIQNMMQIITAWPNLEIQVLQVAKIITDVDVSKRCTGHLCLTKVIFLSLLYIYVDVWVWYYTVTDIGIIIFKSH